MRKILWVILLVLLATAPAFATGFDTGGGTGTGDISGPASSTDNGVPRFSGTGGATLKDSDCTIDDDGIMACPGYSTSGTGGGQINLQEGTPKTTVAGELGINVVNTAGQPELFLRGESNGTNQQITSGGKPLAGVATGNVPGLPRHWVINVPDPDAQYAVDTQILIKPKLDAAVTVTHAVCGADADPATELTMDLKFADSFIGLANATVVTALDTLAGTTETSTFADATIPSGKAVYLQFDTTPDSTMTQFNCDVTYDYD
jgi:hypothetical protein